MPPTLELKTVTKRYGTTLALDEVTLRVDPGEFVAVLGPSGCGKTTLLRVIAGLTEPTSGTLLSRGNPLTSPPHKRPFGFVFQDATLFPHLTVAGNVGFGLDVAGIPGDAREDRVRELLELVDLPGYGARSVHELSGGEKQRVALARALAPGPDVLLMDEPLSALDRALRMRLRREVRALHEELDLTTLYVTHDQEEALATADRVILMREGRIVQSGTPDTVFRQPANAWAARFMGASNTLEGVVKGTNPLLVETALGVLTTQGDVTLDAREDVRAGMDAWVLVPPEALRVTRGDGPGARGRVLEARPRGTSVRLALQVGDEVMEVDASAGQEVHPGDEVRVMVHRGTLRVMPRKG